MVMQKSDTLYMAERRCFLLPYLLPWLEKRSYRTDKHADKYNDRRQLERNTRKNKIGKEEENKEGWNGN